MAIGDGKAKIYISGVQLGEVNSFKYLVVSEDGGYTTDINIRTATLEMSRLDRVWHCYNHVYCKALYKFLVVLSSFTDIKSGPACRQGKDILGIPERVGEKAAPDLVHRT